MFKSIPTFVFGAALLASGGAFAQATVGQPAPAFTATDTAGKAVSLADFKGKYVVLEWTNPGCPFVQKHYDSGNMPATQKDAVAKGAVWLAVNTTAKDAGDYMAPAALQAWVKSKNGVPTATLMDADAKVGRAYVMLTKDVLAYVENRIVAQTAERMRRPTRAIRPGQSL